MTVGLRTGSPRQNREAVALGVMREMLVLHRTESCYVPFAD